MDWNFKLRAKSAVEKSKEFIEKLTVDSDVNYPAKIVTSGNQFFSWDNERRSKENGEPYLYSWSYYNGVVFEGLKYIYEATGEQRYISYIREYLDAMITDGELNEHAGYVPYHGLDCYKTASLMADLCEFDESGKPLDNEYNKVAAGLYHDLVTVNVFYTEEALGGNYWHAWHGKSTLAYKVWLDGIYMAQPFIARYAWKSKDKEQQAAIYKRFRWVSDNMIAPNGLYYHAVNSKEDVCKFFWLRAIGWYAMAQVDVMEYMPEEYLPDMKKDLKRFIDGMLRFQDESGMWKNLVDQPLTEKNRLETSGTAMIIYCILKAIRIGYLEDVDGNYMYAAQKAFCYIVEEKLGDNGLKDIYLVASASGKNVYEIIERYKDDEGKGTGPFIMAYAEMIKVEEVENEKNYF